MFESPIFWSPMFGSHSGTGIFAFQGAIIGPILLCCLIVVFNVYQRILAAESTVADSVPDTANASHIRRLDRNTPDPGIYLHRSTPADIGSPSETAAPRNQPSARLTSPATPNSVFRSSSRGILRKNALLSSRRLHRSSSLPDVDVDN